MKKLAPQVKQLLETQKTWILATAGDQPNATAVFFTKVRDSELVLYDVFMKKTLENLKQNEKVCINAYIFEEGRLEGYQIQGTAKYCTDEDIVKEGNTITSKMNLTTKGAVIVSVKEVYNATPGPDNGKTVC